MPMPCLQLSIIRFVDEHHPGFVECEFSDAIGARQVRNALGSTRIELRVQGPTERKSVLR